MYNNWKYEKVNEDYNIEACPSHDIDGSITGKVIINLPAWFDENPEERIRLGYIKHYYPLIDEIDFDRQTQDFVVSLHVIDDYTVEDVIHIYDKTEEQLMFEEIYGQSSVLPHFVII